METFLNDWIQTCVLQCQKRTLHINITTSTFSIRIPKHQCSIRLLFDWFIVNNCIRQIFCQYYHFKVAIYARKLVFVRLATDEYETCLNITFYLMFNRCSKCQILLQLTKQTKSFQKVLSDKANSVLHFSLSPCGQCYKTYFGGNLDNIDPPPLRWNNKNWPLIVNFISFLLAGPSQDVFLLPHIP